MILFETRSIEGTESCIVLIKQTINRINLRAGARIGRTTALPSQPRRSPPLARQVPNSHRQGQRAQPVSQNRRLSMMNLPALPERDGGCKNHHNASNRIHARILLAPPVKRAAAASILSAKPLDRPRRPQSYDERERNAARMEIPCPTLPPLPHRSKRPRSTPRTARSRPKWSTSAAGTCRSSIPLPAPASALD